MCIKYDIICIYTYIYIYIHTHIHTHTHTHTHTHIYIYIYYKKLVILFFINNISYNMTCVLDKILIIFLFTVFNINENSKPNKISLFFILENNFILFNETHFQEKKKLANKNCFQKMKIENENLKEIPKKIQP